MNKQAFILLILTLITTIFLSGSLSHLNLKPGLKHTFSNQKKISASRTIKGKEESGKPLSQIPIWIVLILGGLILIVSLIGLIRELSWKAIACIIFISVFFSTLVVILKLFPNENWIVEIPAIRIIQKTQLEDPQFNIIMPVWLIVLMISFGMMIILSIGWLLVNLRKGQLNSKKPFSQIAIEAGEAADAIINGEGYRVSIIRCYQKMCDTITNYQGQDRGKSLTAREFNIFLESIGLKSEYIRQLTHLFEKARYRESEPTKKEKAEATICLKLISEMYNEQ